jgi:putative acetyltransferase
MVRIIRTDSSDNDFREMVRLLDLELAVVDGSEHNFYSQFNKIDNIRHAVVAYDNEKPVGCGAIKEYDETSMEVKRMYVLPDNRNRGIASMILRELELWTAEMSYIRCVLETGKRQPEAIALYKKNGYVSIPNYGQYVGVENSVCFEKNISR